MAKIKLLLADIAMLKTKNGRKEFYNKYREIILYLIFGVLTTLISLVSYYLIRILFPDKQSAPEFLQGFYSLTESFGIESNTLLPVVLSWIISVTFAFITNKLIVFKSDNNIFLEFLKFYGARLFTLAVDTVLTFVLIDLTAIHNAIYELAIKILINVIILILNYILSKIFVFVKRKAS